MSTNYKHSHEVPTARLARRLDELSDAVRMPGEERDRELTMRIPAEVDRDADLVLGEAARRLRNMEAEIGVLAARVADQERAIKLQASAAKRGMDAAKARGGHMEAEARRLYAESSPEALESERRANAQLTAELETMAAHVERLHDALEACDAGWQVGSSHVQAAHARQALQRIRSESPTTSLARLKVEWQATVAKSSFLYGYGFCRANGFLFAEQLEEAADEYVRRQAMGGA